ncbi:hypothetical protein Q0590_36055 [Rhodocytophaga aerolata]|uniref:DUF4369 domain-containing protein n=1 Tax=Rhodocytophaga aerolata TaxID=455078 RepID=A0ABT8RIE3_9BACT|nr:hypothetical protein [Rhodocytophaga aerolata]MDO1451744.1 hypothetical protein [Rhodocytophaga aerolata]
MQKFLCCFLLAVAIHFTLRAQQAPLYTINAGEIVSDVIPLNEQYVYGEFQQGTVWFRNGKSLPALLNYNRLYGEMQFIGSKGDTLALVEENSLKKITIGKQVFYYMHKNSFVELLTAQLPVKLARKQNLEIIRSTFRLVRNSGIGSTGNVFAGERDDTMNGPFNSSTHTSSLSYRKLYTQKVPGELQLAKQSSYYFVDQNERVHQAKKSTLLKLFGRHKQAIEDYIDTNQVDFTREVDLKNLLEYCAQWINK